MNFKKILQPFTWFAFGLGGILKFVVNVIKRIVLFIWSLIQNFAKGLFSIVVFVVKIIGKLFYYLFKAIKFILLNIGLGIKIIVIWIYKLIAFIFKYLFLAFKYLFKYLFLAFKYFFVYLFNGLKLIVKYIYIVFKYIFIGIYKGFSFIGIYLYKIVKFIITYIIKFVELIFMYLWYGIKGIGWLLYKVFIYPFVYLYNNFRTIINKFFNNIKTSLNKAGKAIIAFPRKVKDSVVNWYNNISFIKDSRNRREMKRQKLLIDFDAEDAVRSEQKVMYRYVAKNPNGKIEKGRLGAYSKLDVHSYLLAEGYEVYEIEVFKGINLTFGTHYKIKSSELVFFLTQLSTYIKAGIPLVDSIKILSKQSKQKQKNDLYKSVIYELTMGDNFSEALEKQGTAFPRLLINMTKSAELAGNLPETLDDMANYYDAVHKTKKQMTSAMMYPAVISVFALSVVTFIMVFVIPEFIDIYRDMNAEIPAITTAVINISDFLQHNILYLIIGIIAAIVGLISLYKYVKIFRIFVQWTLMHMPVVGKIIIYNEVTMFSKTFGSLLNHNVFITDSMEILSKITNNEIYKMLIFDTMTNIARGEPISNSFKDNWAFPIVAYEMLVTGERTGQPGEMMDKVANYYQEEHKNAINQIKVFIEPVMIIFLAAVVGLILLSVILPMFSIYGNLGPK